MPDDFSLHWCVFQEAVEEALRLQNPAPTPGSSSRLHRKLHESLFAQESRNTPIADFDVGK